MAQEIEHKYLVHPNKWEYVKPIKSIPIRQGYICSSIEKTIRVRTTGDSGYITIKGKINGATCAEFEYAIPMEDALELLQTMCEAVIDKIRHFVLYKEKMWEVDEFKGRHAGLMIAEIELEREDQFYDLPEWAIKNVTGDYRFTNVHLAFTSPFNLSHYS